MGIIYSTKALQPRRQYDHYPTPSGLVRAALELVPDGMNVERILDPASGTGVWGAVARKRWPEAFIEGVELQVANPCASYDSWKTMDYFRFLAAHHNGPYDLIIGNPPYGKPIKTMAELFVRASMSVLAPEGKLMFLLRSAFFEGIDRGRDFFVKHRPTDMYQLMRRPSFTGNNKTDSTAYALFVWDHTKPNYTRAWHLDWEYGESTPEDRPFKATIMLMDSQMEIFEMFKPPIKAIQNSLF